jgi:uncharacterized protein with PIN domain
MENNPLRQYFRRPAVYIKLPSEGKYYNEDVVDIPESGELPVYPMTAIDEISVRTPDALYNGTAVRDLIASCIPNIKNPWLINSSDLDAILLAIKAASGQESLEIESSCPECENQSTFNVDLPPLIATISPGNYEEELVHGDIAIKFRPLTYKEMSDAALIQFDLQRKFLIIERTEDEAERDKLSKEALESVTIVTMQVLSSAIEYIKTPDLSVNDKEFILDFLKNCDKNLFAKIRDQNGDLRKETELKPMNLSCTECNHQYEQKFTVDPTDFFG